MTMTTKTTKTKAQLKSEKETKEDEYNQSLTFFKKSLYQTNEIQRGKILELAKKLEKAGTVEIHLICRRIVKDLQKEISLNMISDWLIWDTLELKYKEKTKSETGGRRWKDYSGGDKTQKLFAVLHDWTKLEQSTIVSQPVQKAVEESEDYRFKELHEMNDKQLVLTIQAATYLVGVLNDLVRVGKKIAEQRHTSDKLWSR